MLIHLLLANKIIYKTFFIAAVIAFDLEKFKQGTF